MAARRNCGHRVRGGWFVQRKRERIADDYAAVRAAILQVFGQQHAAVLQLRRGDDQAVPPAEAVAKFDVPGALAMAVVLLVFSFALLAIINVLEQWAGKFAKG